MNRKDLIRLIQELIREKNWKLLKKELNLLYPHLIAEVMEELTSPEDIIVFRLLGRDLAKDTFSYLTPDDQAELARELAQDGARLAALLNDLDPDDRTAFFEELPGQVSQRLMQLLSASEKEVAQKLLGYPEDSIGRLMTPEYIALKPHFTVAWALQHIREFGKDSETINILYLVDSQWKLIGELSIRDILMAPEERPVGELTDGTFVALTATDDQETAVKMFRDTDKIALPVVDSEGVLLGIVTVDDVMDVAEEENTEDFQKFGSLQDAVVNPLKARIGFLYKQRILWLLALVFMNIFSGALLASFEDVIGSVVALVFFLPLLIDSGGNAGSQSATLMIRSLAVGDVQMKDWIRLLGKELGVSLLLGITMALGVSLIATFRAPEVVMVVAATMVLIVIAGSMIGMLLPFIFTKLKFDPAMASAPLITSICDITGVFIYFSVAGWYFGF